MFHLNAYQRLFRRHLEHRLRARRHGTPTAEPFARDAHRKQSTEVRNSAALPTFFSSVTWTMWVALASFGQCGSRSHHFASVWVALASEMHLPHMSRNQALLSRIVRSARDFESAAAGSLTDMAL